MENFEGCSSVDHFSSEQGELLPQPALTWATLAQCDEFGIRPTIVGWTREWIRHQLDRMALAGSVLLDLGSHTSGPLTHWYAPRVRHSVLVDLHHPPGAFPNSTPLIHDLETPLPLAEESVDIVISSSTFQFLSPAARRLQMRDIQRVLRPGGYALISLSWLFPLTDCELAVLAAEPVLRERHIYYQSPPDVIDLLTDLPLMRIDGAGKATDFPGSPLFSPTKVLTDSRLLVKDLTAAENTVFRPEIFALGIQQMAIGIRLRKAGEPKSNAPPMFSQPQQDVPTKPIQEYPAVIVHVHLPKNAGTSFNDLLSSSFGDRFVKEYFPDPNRRFDDPGFREFVRSHPHAMAVASHSFAVFPSVVAGRRPLYITFLRHPLARHRSYCRYARVKYKYFTLEHRKHLPVNFLSMTDDDFTNFISNLAEARLINMQTQLLCGHDNPRAAIKVLSQFFFVGLVEQMGRSVDVLRKKLGCEGIQLQDQPLIHANATATEREDVSPNSEAEERLLRHLSSDVRIYEWARSEFEINGRNTA